VAAAEPNAVEIAAMLGDSVVGMKHCLDPHGGKVSRKTWAAVAAGAVALVAAGVAFAVSVATAAANERALAAWQHPRAAFRAEQLSPAWDWLAVGGLALGIAALGWALLRVRDERRSPYYRIGTAPGVEQPCEGAPAASFALVAPAGDGFVFQFAHGVDVQLLEQHARESVALAGSGTLPIAPGTRIRARVGQTTFLVSSTPRPRCEARARIELPAMKYLAGSLAGHVVMWALLCRLPVDADGADVELTTQEALTLRTSEIDRDAAAPPTEPSGGTGGGHESGPAAAGMKLAEGAAGSRASTSAPAHLEMMHRADVDLQYSRTEVVEVARHAGILGASSPVYTGLAALAADQDLANGFETKDVMGPMYGPDGPVGSGGFGTGQLGLDHGGDGWATIGSGEYGVICGSATRECGGGGPGGTSIGGLPRRHVAAYPIIHDSFPRDGNVIGEYDRTIIRRYIHRNMAKLSYCYEHELLARSDLAGDIVVDFFIQPNGTVSAATATGFDATVASCVAGVVNSIEFPAPRGEGIEVHYPFAFQRTGTQAHATLEAAGR
jgi:hypothetical protein